MLVLVMAMVSRCTTPSIVATNAIRLGDDASNRKNYQEAARHYTQYLQLSPQLGLYRNPLMEAQVHRKLGYVYSTQGNYQVAIGHVHKAIGIDSLYSEAQLELIAAFRDLGILNGFAGDYPNALKYLSRSLDMTGQITSSRKEERRSSVADTYIAAAKIHMALGNFKEVEEFTTRGLEIYEGMASENEGIIEATFLLSIVKRDRNQLDDAREFVNISLKLAKQHQLSTARQNQLLGDIAFLRGDIEEAIRHQLMAVEDAEHSKIKPQVLVAYMKLGDVYLALGDRKRAGEYYKRAISIKNEMQGPDASESTPSLELRFGDVRQSYGRHAKQGSLVGTALASLRLGALYLDQANLDSAQLLFEKAKALLTEAEQPEGIARSNLELARIALRKGLYGDAEKLLRAVLSTTIQPEYKYQAFYQIGLLRELEGAPDSSYAYYSRAIEVIDQIRGNLTIEEFKTLLANSKVAVYDRIIALLMQSTLHGVPQNEAVVRALHYSEQSRSRAFLDMLGNQKIVAKTSNDDSLLEEEQLVKLKIQQLTRELHNTDQNSNLRKQLVGELEAARIKYEEVIHKLKLNNEAYVSVTNVEPPLPEEVQKILPKGTAVVEYWLGEKSLTVWVVTNEKIIGRVVNISRREVSREIAFFRKSISIHEREMTNESSQRLTNHLIRPIEDLFAGVGSIVFVPHGDLHFIPFQALRTGTGDYLLERFNISSSPSSAVLHYCASRRPPEGDRILAMALGSIEIGGFPGLPGTESELEKIRQIYPEADWVSGAASSETFLKSKASECNFLHIATHGAFNKLQPLYSYLLMTPGEHDDGQLTVREIFELQLQCKLVTLSACETGLGDIGEADDLIGMSRAFIYAGAPAVVVSLWKVDDATTATIMAGFYRNLKKGLPASEALTAAQRDFLDQETVLQRQSSSGKIKSIRAVTNMHPYFWASFVLLGDAGTQ